MYTTCITGSLLLQVRKMTSANIPAPVRVHGVDEPDLVPDTGKDASMAMSGQAFWFHN